MRGRPFKKGRSGNPGGRRQGSYNKATVAAPTLLARESEALTRKTVEMALAGDPAAMRLCMERVLPPCLERIVKFRLPPIEGTLTGETSGPSARDVSRAMNAVTSALARGEITPGEAETIAGLVDTFVRAIETTKKEASRLNLLPLLMTGNYDDDNSDDNSEDDCEDDCDGEEYEETGNYEETDDCDS